MGTSSHACFTDLYSAEHHPHQEDIGFFLSGNNVQHLTKEQANSQMNSLLNFITCPRKLRRLMASLLRSINTSGLLCCTISIQQPAELQQLKKTWTFGLSLTQIIFFFLYIGNSLLIFPLELALKSPIFQLGRRQPQNCLRISKKKKEAYLFVEAPV